MFVLKEKIDQWDDESWKIFFPKLLHNMAVYLDRDRENFRKCISEMHEELKRLEQEGGKDPDVYDDDEDE